MIDQDFLTIQSRKCLENGVRILQGYRLADTDEDHVTELLQRMGPMLGTLWADVGCGFGEVARLMSRQRPDLGFVLINNNKFQLDCAPNRFLRLHTDMQDIPLPDASVDGCMFLYSLCHAEVFGVTLWEAARITRPGGALFVFDYERMFGDDTLFLARLSSRALSFDRMHTIAKDAGWDIKMWDHPRGNDTLFRQLYEDQAEYERIFTELTPVIWKAVRV